MEKLWHSWSCWAFFHNFLRRTRDVQGFCKMSSCERWGSWGFGYVSLSTSRSAPQWGRRARSWSPPCALPLGSVQVSEPWRINTSGNWKDTRVMELLINKQNVFLHGRGGSRSWHLTKLAQVTLLINYWQSQTLAWAVGFPCQHFIHSCSLPFSPWARLCFP